jgi:protein-tyrosine phosphatase
MNRYGSILGLIPNPADRVSTRNRGVLYLGSVGALDPTFLRTHHIKVIISMNRHVRTVSTVGLIHHYKFPVADSLLSNPQMQKMLPGITALIDKHLKAGHNVLVHCKAGIHRAPTVVSHYLQKYEGSTVEGSVKRIRAVRPIAFIDGNTFDLQAQ